MSNIAAVREAISNRECLFGTLDSWIIWNLTGGAIDGLHMTDVTNASRTMLMNLSTLNWDTQLCRFFQIPQHILPQIRSCAEIYGFVFDGPLKGLPIGAVSSSLRSRKNVFPAPVFRFIAVFVRAVGVPTSPVMSAHSSSHLHIRRRLQSSGEHGAGDSRLGARAVIHSWVSAGRRRQAGLRSRGSGRICRLCGQVAQGEALSRR